MIFVADAHRDGKRFVVRADEKLTAFMELESVICLDRATAFLPKSASKTDLNQAEGFSPARVPRLFRTLAVAQINLTGEKKGRHNEPNT